MSKAHKCVWTNTDALCQGKFNAKCILVGFFFFFNFGASNLTKHYLKAISRSEKNSGGDEQSPGGSADVCLTLLWSIASLYFLWVWATTHFPLGSCRFSISSGNPQSPSSRSSLKPPLRLCEAVPSYTALLGLHLSVYPCSLVSCGWLFCLRDLGSLQLSPTSSTKVWLGIVDWISGLLCCCLRGSLLSPGWPGAHFVDLASLELWFSRLSSECGEYWLAH